MSFRLLIAFTVLLGESEGRRITQRTNGDAAAPPPAPAPQANVQPPAPAPAPAPQPDQPPAKPKAFPKKGAAPPDRMLAVEEMKNFVLDGWVGHLSERHSPQPWGDAEIENCATTVARDMLKDQVLMGDDMMATIADLKTKIKAASERKKGTIEGAGGDDKKEEEKPSCSR